MKYSDDIERAVRECRRVMSAALLELTRQHEAELAMRWISVNERLPDINQEVLIYHNGVQVSCRMDLGPVWDWRGIYFYGPQPTHWMPLPKAPGSC